MNRKDKKLLVIVAIHNTRKRRSLFDVFAFVYIEHERFRFLLSYVKHDEYFEILRNERNSASRVDDLA